MFSLRPVETGAEVPRRRSYSGCIETHLPDWALNESPKSTAKGWAVGARHLRLKVVIGQWSRQVRSNGQWSMVNAYRSTVDQ